MNGICVEAAFVALVLDEPKPGSAASTIDARAHLEPREGSSPLAPESITLIVEKAGAPRETKALSLVSGTYRYEGRVSLQGSGAFLLQVESAESGLVSEKTAITVIACLAHAECGVCQACRDGACVDQGPTEDLKDECDEVACASGLCDGAGACGFKPANATCRAAEGPCDAVETCSGSGPECPDDGVKPEGTVCKQAAGDCDLEERCDGVSKSCPTDTFKPASIECRPATDLCDEPAYCTGDSARCPKNPLKSADAPPCRPAAAGGCDLEERCDGQSPQCPADLFAPATTVCRPAVDACDAKEACTGSSALCPADGKQPSGHPCGAESCTATTYTPPPVCTDTGACIESSDHNCGPYFCGATACLTSCDDNSNCVAGLCDFRDRTCPVDVVAVNCALNGPSALQTAIDNCAAGTKCFLQLVDGICDKVRIQNKDVYIAGTAGAMIAPSSLGPAVLVREEIDETTKAFLADVTIQGALGAMGDGLRSTGIDGGTPEVEIVRTVVGTSAVGGNNSGHGINASSSTVTVTNSTVQNNSQAGINASSSTVTVTDSTVQNNTQAGINASGSDVTIRRSAIQLNSHSGLALLNSTFAVTNCIIALNGLTSRSFGVDILSNTDGLTKHFSHNTVASNGGGGMSCAGSESATTVHSSLFWNPGAQELSACLSDSTSDIPGLQDSCGDGGTPPDFVNPQPPNPDFHLQPTSACKDKVPCDPQVQTDIDGDERPQPVGGLCDVGADEVR